MNRKFSFSVNEYYHIYSRGNDKRDIFGDHYDYRRFIRLMYLLNTDKSVTFRDVKISGFNHERGNTIVEIGAYCLMPNHFHILIKEKVDGGISLFLKKLLTSHSMFYNKKYSRTGKLFEGHFKATYIDNDNYLKYIYSYIHLNPVKLIEPKWKEIGIKDDNRVNDYLNGYEYSSYLDYIGIDRQENKILDTKAFPEYFTDKESVEREVFEWLSYEIT